jgi:predicted oxidoreductase
LDYCRLHHIQVQAYSPLRGNLINPPSDATQDVKRAAQLLADLATQKHTNPSAVALAWLLHHPANIVPVIGATNLEHVVENCEGDRVILTNDEWYALLRSTASISA